MTATKLNSSITERSAPPTWFEFYSGALSVQLWGRLGWNDVKRRYRRTVLGPWWTTISLSIFVLAIGAMGAGLWDQEVAGYLTYLSSGMVVWILLSTITMEGTVLFTNEAQNIQQLKFNYSILAFACIWRNLIAFAHNILVYIVLAVIFSRLPVTPVVLLVIPGAILLLLNGLWIAILLGVLSARFRDIQQLTASIVQIAMFVTPIFWPPQKLEGVSRAVFVDYHPLYHMIEVMRAPILGNVPAVESYIASLLILAVGGTITYFVYARFNRRIVYWL